MSFKANGQEVKVIDNKGTIKTINNNNVFTSPTDPNSPTVITVENDIWFDTSTSPTSIKIWDDTAVWTNMSDTTSGNSPITAMGKIAANGNPIKITSGYTVTKLTTGNGRYRVNFTTALADNNYIIQLAALANNKIINYVNQQPGSFEVSIRRNNNNSNPIDSEFMFTITDFSSTSTPTAGNTTTPTFPNLSNSIFPIYYFNDDNTTNGGDQEIRTGYAQSEPNGYPSADAFEITITDVAYDILNIISGNIENNDITSTINVASGPSATGTGYDHLITVNSRINQYQQLQIFFNTNVNGSCSIQSCRTVNFYTN